jgi:hypothetical protein
MNSCRMMFMALCATPLFSSTSAAAFAPPSAAASTRSTPSHTAAAAAVFTRHCTTSACTTTTTAVAAAATQSRLFLAKDDEDEGWGTSSSKASEVVAAMAQEDTQKKKSNDDGGSGVLPELKGDFDWDAKFGNDVSSWITENVPGKIVLNEVELARQVTALSQLEDKWRNEREIQEYEAERKVGWVIRAETLNGRTAMFFLVTGLLTEYWTGFTLPQQVEEMLRIGGVIGFE